MISGCRCRGQLEELVEFFVGQNPARRKLGDGLLGQFQRHLVLAPQVVGKQQPGVAEFQTGLLQRHLAVLQGDEGLHGVDGGGFSEFGALAGGAVSHFGQLVKVNGKLVLAVGKVPVPVVLGGGEDDFVNHLDPLGVGQILEHPRLPQRGPATVDEQALADGYGESEVRNAFWPGTNVVAEGLAHVAVVAEFEVGPAQPHGYFQEHVAPVKVLRAFVHLPVEGALDGGVEAASGNQKFALRRLGDQTAEPNHRVVFQNLPVVFLISEHQRILGRSQARQKQKEQPEHFFHN